MACREHLAATLPRSPNPLSKSLPSGAKSPEDFLVSDADKQSVIGREREKEFSEIEGTMRECL